MSEKNDKDLEKTKELFEFLQGRTPDGYIIQGDHQPVLTPDQAWTVVWYLGNQYWQPTDAVERCDVCGDLYHSWQEGECMDYGNAPYHFCGNCDRSPEAHAKARTGRGLERAKKRQCSLSNGAVNRDL